MATQAEVDKGWADFQSGQKRSKEQAASDRASTNPNFSSISVSPRADSKPAATGLRQNPGW